MLLDGHSAPSVAERLGLSGPNVLYRWNHELGERSDWMFQMYYDRFHRASSNNYFAFDIDTYDVDFQHQFPLNDRNQVVWGLGYRVNDVFFRGSTVDGAFAIGPAGAANAALFAVAMLANEDAALHQRLLDFRTRQTAAARAMTQDLK